MPKHSVVDFAKIVGISRQAINDLCKRGDLRRVEKKIDTDDPVNAAWIQARLTCPPPPHPPGRWGTPPPPPPADDVGYAGFDLDGILNGTVDLRTVAKVDVEKYHKLEAMLKIRVEREQRRGDLVDRKLVQTVFAKLFTIDSNEWCTLGAKLAAEIAGLFESSDPALVLRVEKLIDTATRKTLAHVKRTLDDFLVKIGAEGI